MAYGLARNIVLDSPRGQANNEIMVIPGRVNNGVGVPQGTESLPEGAVVSITYRALAEPRPTSEKRQIQVPLIRTGEPGSVSLTGARIAEILDAEDAHG